MVAERNQALGLEVSISSLAREFNIARETVGKRLLAWGVKPSGRNRGNDVYRLGAAARAIVAAEYGGAEPNQDPDVMQPRDKLDFYRSQNEKIKFDKESGKLVDVDDHREVVAGMAKILTQQLESIPDLLERKCNLLPDQLEVVESTIEVARNELADQLDEYELS